MTAALFFCIGSMSAGTVEDRLAKFDKDMSVANANAFFDALNAEQFTDEAILFKNGTPEDSLRQQVWYWAAEWLYDQQQYEQAAVYGQKALPLFHYENDDRAGCLNILGCIFVRMGDVKQAADYAKKCLAIDMKSGDHDRISSSMNTVAGIYMAGYQAKEAEQYILQALEHAEKAGNPARKAVILGMASEIYHTLGDDQKALPYAEQAYRIDSTLNRQPQAVIRQSQCASALLGLHRYQEAEGILRKVVPALREIGDAHSYAIALNRLGMSLLCQKREREAIPYYQEAAALFSKMGDLYNEIHSHRGLYESYWTINPDSAKKELDYFDLLKDSLYTHATADALSRYNAEFGNDQLQQENEEARQQHRYFIGAIIVILLLCAIAAWYMVRQMRIRQQQTQELIKEIERLKEEMSEKPTEAETEDVSASDVPDEDRQFLMRVIEVVNEGMATGQIGVEQIASALNMSVQTFRRRLQSAAGETPKAFVSAIQMEKAGKLLKDNPALPVLQVASLCGFEEASSFTHTFKRVYGMSPKQYREQE
jgi:AraC-like DNA-binding protein